MEAYGLEGKPAAVKPLAGKAKKSPRAAKKKKALAKKRRA
jgi:hypothetical protein